METPAMLNGEKIQRPFFNLAITSGLDRGYRCVNKGDRDIYDRLPTKEKRLADETPGREIGLYLVSIS